jgi:hypothetical protein
VRHFATEFRSGLHVQWIALAPLLAILLCACSALGVRHAPPSPPLLAPSSLGRSIDALQIVRGAHGDQEMAFQCVVEVDAQQLTVIGLSAQGQRLFSLRYDGEKLEAESTALAPTGLDPRRVLADLQLALWPIAALRQSFAGTPWKLGEPAPATRRLLRGGRLVAEVHYGGADPWQGPLWLSNFESGYSLSIESRPSQ